MLSAPLLRAFRPLRYYCGRQRAAHEFTVNKTEAGGIYFGGYSENEFSDASLNIADGQVAQRKHKNEGKPRCFTGGRR
ncbi:MAG: hypothetical protein ACLR56_14095 [Oscillospiraceae bacterium]